MKKVFRISTIYFYLLFSPFIFSTVIGQNYVKIDFNGSSLTPGQSITVPVKVNIDLPTQAVAYDLLINYNKDVLTYTGINSQWPNSTPGNWGINNSSYSNGIKISYIDPAYFGFNMVNQVLFNLVFTYNGGTTSINVNTTLETTFYDASTFNAIPFTPMNGSSDGPKASITSLAGGGLWSAGSTWDRGYVPNPSANSSVTIASNPATPVTISNDLTLNNDLTINANAALTVASGKTLAVSGDFTVKSDASFINNGTITGNVKVERLVSGNKWHLLASPIVGATSNMFSPALNANIPIYLRMHDEATNAWSYITDLVTPITPTQGYAIWADAGSPTINYTGTLNANASIPYTSNGLGWNLMGNPYTSALDWNTVTGKANISGGAFYCWNSVEGKYSVSDGQAGVNQLNIVSPYIIPAMQGFFVKATAAGSLGISTAKIHSAVPYYKSSNSLNDMVRLTAQRGLFKDEALVVMNSSATNNYDEAYDASKFFANNTDIPEIYTLAGSEKIAINKIGSFPAVVPVNIKMGVADNVTITASDFANFDASVYIILEDMLNGTFQNLRQNPSYTFAAAIGENAGRFNLHFSYIALGIDNLQNKNANIYSSNNTIYVNSSEKINDISVYNMLGQLIVNKAGNLNAMNTITVQAANAYYIVKVTTVNGVYTEKVYVK